MTDQTVLIIGASDRLRDGVEALLLANPAIAGVEVVDSGPAAVTAVRNGCPTLVVVIMWTVDDVFPASLRSSCPGSRFLALGGDADLENAANAAGIDSFALIGTPASRLGDIVTNLLSDGDE